MNQALYDLAAGCIKTAQTAGASACRVNIESDRLVEVSYRQRQPENIKEAATKGLAIEIFANGRYSSQSTSDLRKKALTTFIQNAVATTKLLAEDPFRSLPDPKYYAGQAKADLDLLDPEYSKVTPEARHELVQAIEAACLAKGGDKVISVTASESDHLTESLVMTSNGFTGYTQYTYFVASSQMTIQDAGDRRPNGAHYLVAIHKRDLQLPDEFAATTVKRTFDLMGGKKIKTETLPIIIENRVVGNMLGGFLAGMYGRNIQQKQSFLADKKGQKIASDRFTLIDDPHIVRGLGSELYDGDGFATKKRVMVEAGVLKDFYVDWYYSRKLGWEPTSGGPSNLILPPGSRSVKEIMKDLGRGILITGFIGGNSNSTTGDASIGIIGHLFEGGEPVQAVAEMNIADNHLKFWQRLAEVANDPWIYSSFRLPSLVFTDVVVSGI
ncbi:TldD/PmbA family protein [candidate division KSB1 bacterium]|nr:TldD/PmbA family protein [candidate division KSB1 bacterium]